MNLRSDRKDYKKAIYKFGYGFVYRLMRPWFRVPIIYHLSSISKEIEAAVKVLHSFSTGVINERKKSLKETGQYSSEKKGKMALIDILFKAKDTEGADINDDGIREEIDTFMFEVRQPQLKEYQSVFYFCFTRYLSVEIIPNASLYLESYHQFSVLCKNWF